MASSTSHSVVAAFGVDRNATGTRRIADRNKNYETETSSTLCFARRASTRSFDVPCLGGSPRTATQEQQCLSACYNVTFATAASESEGSFGGAVRLLNSCSIVQRTPFGALRRVCPVPRGGYAPRGVSVRRARVFDQAHKKKAIRPYRASVFLVRIPEGTLHEAHARYHVSPTHSAPTGIRLLQSSVPGGVRLLAYRRHHNS